MMHGANDTMRSVADTLRYAADTVCGAADMMGVAAVTMHGAADMMAQWVSQDQCQTPPYMEKNKLILNQYLGIFMHFETIFFFNLENGLFQTHTPTKSGKFQIFFFIFDPFPN